MAARTRIDKAGRVVIPKPLRDDLGLGPGDSLVAESTGQYITLRPEHDATALRKERGFWVYRTGRPLKDLSITAWIDRGREARGRGQSE